MTDENPILALVFNNTSFVGPAEEVENEVTPLDSQLNLQPGDHAIAATANTPLERDWIICTVIDPEAHAEIFPDWEERLLNSFVLCEYDSMEDPSPEARIGWFSRVKLVPISEEGFARTREWLPDKWPDLAKLPPDWIVEHFDEFSDALSERAPKRVPTAVKCFNCGGRQVHLEVSRRMEYSVRCGRITRDDKEMLVSMADVEVKDNHVAKLHCLDCDSYADLKDEEWQLPGYSN